MRTYGQHIFGRASHTFLRFTERKTLSLHTVCFRLKRTFLSISCAISLTLCDLSPLFPFSFLHLLLAISEWGSFIVILFYSLFFIRITLKQSFAIPWPYLSAKRLINVMIPVIFFRQHFGLVEVARFDNNNKWTVCRNMCQMRYRYFFFFLSPRYFDELRDWEYEITLITTYTDERSLCFTTNAKIQSKMLPQIIQRAFLQWESCIRINSVARFVSASTCGAHWLAVHSLLLENIVIFLSKVMLNLP